jgi:SAM-dependent methyltransferase
VNTQPPDPDDRFSRVAANYDQWIDWGPRLGKEMPFLLASLPPGIETAEGPFSGTIGGILDVGCGTGAHAIALAAAGHRVVGLDLSAAMLEQAKAAEARSHERHPARPVEWVQGDVGDATVLPARWYRGVLALGNVLLAFGNEKAVQDGLEAMVRSVAPGGMLVLQYLNGARIRAEGRLVVKSGKEIWLRHHFEAGGELYFHSYVLKPNGAEWTAEVQMDKLVDFPPERVLGVLASRFDRIEFCDGLNDRPFDPLKSDAVGVRASGRR